MSETDAGHATDTTNVSHDDAGHGHEAAAGPLGPVDVRMWAVAIGGGAVGVIVALVMFAAAQS